MWAEKMKEADLFAGLVRSPEHVKRKSSGATLSRKTKMAQDLQAEKDRVYAMMTSQITKPTSPEESPPGQHKTSHDPHLPAFSRSPSFDTTSLDAIRTCTGFLEEHINSLKWIQQCLIYHQKTLIRTRNLTQSTVDSLGRISYMQSHHRDLLEVVEGYQGLGEKVGPPSKNL